MSKQIKFRAWDSHLKFFTATCGYFIELDGSAWFNLGDGEGGDDLLEQSDKLIIEQFTGLLDKNGVEIYCGDIIQSATHRESTHVIVWNADYCRFNAAFILLDGELDECSLYNSWVQECEKVVIGNIHEHPELLEQQ